MPLKRTQTQYFTQNTPYGDTVFKKPQPLEHTTPVKTPKELAIMTVMERQRVGGFQGNPFLQYMKYVGSNSAVGTNQILRQCAMILLSYTGEISDNDEDNYVISLEASGFKSGMFSKIKFIGPLEPLNNWLQISEKRLEITNYNREFREYAMFCYTFTVVK
jgi:hypothetical protein